MVTKKNEENGFSLRVRLGDVLTMLTVLLQAVAVIGSILLGYVNLVDRIGTVESRLSAVETQLKMQAATTADHHR